MSFSYIRSVKGLVWAAREEELRFKGTYISTHQTIATHIPDSEHEFRSLKFVAVKQSSQIE